MQIASHMTARPSHANKRLRAVKDMRRERLARGGSRNAITRPGGEDDGFPITISVVMRKANGHNLPQEAPKAFADAILKVMTL